MPGRRLAALLAAAGITAFGFACDSFGGDGSASSSSSSSGGPNDAAVGPDGNSDGQSGEDATVPPACGAVQPLDVSKNDIFVYTPQSEQATTFGIVTDDAFVYWLEQTRANGSATNIYDGKGSSQLRRAPVKENATAEVLASDLGQALHLARIGSTLFFMARKDSTTSLLRVDANCQAPCSPIPIWSETGGLEPWRLLANGDSGLVMLGGNGSLHTFDGVFAATARHANHGGTASYPGLVVVPPMAYASSFDRPDTYAFDTTSNLSMAEARIAFPEITGSPTVGANFLASHCGFIYGRRGDNWFWRARLDGTSFERWSQPAADAAPPGGYFDAVFDVRSDDDYIYVAAANDGGVSAIARDTGLQTILYRGNVFQLGVSEKAIVWGEHDVKSKPMESGIIHYRLKR